MANEYEWLSHDNRLRLTTRATAPDRQESPLAINEPTTISVWTGSAWYEKTAQVGLLRIRKEPPRRIDFDCISLFNLCDGPTVASGWSLTKIFTEGEVLEQSQSGSEIRYVLSLDPNRLGIVEAIFDFEPQLRLLSLRYDIIAPDGDEYAGEIKLRIHYYVEEWESYGQLLLPKVAYRDGYTYHRRIHEVRGIGPRASRTILRRFTARDRSADPPEDAQFSLTAEPGYQVSDERANLRYEMGSDELEVDGFRFSLNEPVREDPAVNLPYLIAHAESDTPVPVDHSDHFHPETHDPMARAITFGGIAFLACFLGLTLWRRHPGRGTA